MKEKIPVDSFTHQPNPQCDKHFVGEGTKIPKRFSEYDDPNDLFPNFGIFMPREKRSQDSVDWSWRELEKS